MTTARNRFYAKLGGAVAGVLVVLVAVRLLFFGADGSPPPDPPPAETDKVVSWEDAAQHYGQICVVEGTVVRTHNSGKACFLNFHPDWREHFTAVIFAQSFSRFPPDPERHYHGKRVRVSGMVKEYQGKPEIVLEAPEQIEVLD